MNQQGSDAEGGWFYHRADIYRQTSCFLAVNLIADSLYVDELVLLITVHVAFRANI